MTTRILFDEARRAYGGSKNGLENEYANFVYRGKNPLRGQPKYNPDEAVKLLLPAIQSQIAERKQKKENDQFVPAWKNFRTWINNQCWTQECSIVRVSEQRSKQIDANNRKRDRRMYTDWIKEQPLEQLRAWGNAPQNRRLAWLVLELRPEIKDRR